MAELISSPAQSLMMPQSPADLPPEYAMMRMENEMIQSLAIARPRDHKAVRDEIVAQLDAYPSFAEAAIYSKPVGKDDRGEMQYAVGLSIRAAEAIAEAYGYNRIKTDTLPIDEDHVKVVATFVDYQKGRIWEDSGIVSRYYKDRKGKMVRHSDDRFYNIVVKAELSKRIREVILRSVPPGLRTELLELAERKIGKLLGGQGVQKILNAFAKLKITQEQLERYVGRTIGQGWTQDDRIKLLGLFNAIEAGEVSVDEIFGASESPTKSANPSSPITGETLIRPSRYPSGGHDVVEEAAAKEVAAGPNGTIPPVGEAALGEEETANVSVREQAIQEYLSAIETAQSQQEIRSITQQIRQDDRLESADQAQLTQIATAKAPGRRRGSNGGLLDN